MSLLKVLLLEFLVLFLVYDFCFASARSKEFSHLNAWSVGLALAAPSVPSSLRGSFPHILDDVQNDIPRSVVLGRSPNGL